MSEMTHEKALNVSLSIWYDDKDNGYADLLRSNMEEAIRVYLDARGLVMVPKVATSEMLHAGNMQALCGMDKIIAAAIAAAPDPFAPSP